MTKTIITLLASFSVVLSATFYELTNIVSFELEKNIYLDKDISDYDINVDSLPNYSKPSELLKVYKRVLTEHNMTLVKDDGFYYVEYTKPPTMDYYSYKVQNLFLEDISSLLTIFPSLNYKLLKESDTVVFHATLYTAKKILKLLKTADLQSKQKRIKVTILNTNNLKAKEYGTKIDKLGLGFDNFLTLLVGTPLSTNHKLANTASFNAFLSYMNNEGITNIEQSPTLLLRDGKKTEFKSVTNIPFLSQTQEVTDTRTNSIESLEYKDVGLTVSILPKIKNGYLYLDFNLISEDLLTERDNVRPVTQKIEYSNSLKLLDGETLLLTGLRKKSFKKTGFKVPVLGDVPILDILFDYRSESESLENISILIESL